MLQLQPVDYQVIGWLTDGYQSRPNDDIVEFLRHLLIWRRASSLSVDGFIFIEENHQLADDFKEKINEVTSQLPNDYDICLLSYLITTWEGIKFIPDTNELLCTISDNVHGSYAYFIRSHHLHRLLAIYDKPCKEIGAFELNDKTLTRTGRVCMINKPIVGYFKDDNLKRYFNKIGIKQQTKDENNP